MKYHKQLPVTNPNKIEPNLQGIMLHSRLYGRAADIVKSVPEVEVEAENGADAIV